MPEALRIHLFKYHGLGNDFLLVDSFRGPHRLDAEWVRRLCDRHFGVGADGILTLHPPSAAGADLKMIVHNADGSQPETCGNGLRCAAFHAVRTRPELRDRTRLEVETAAGVVEARLSCLGEFAAEVRVAMGTPRLLGGEVPVADPLPTEGRVVRVPLEAGGREVHVTCLSMGNPHAVSFDEAVLEGFETLGRELAVHPAFPEGVNVGLAEVRGREALRLAVWERGAGPTLACGSGACAAVVAGILEERLDAGRPVRVELPGGPLQVDVSPDLSQVYMTGPARFVFETRVDLRALEEPPCA